MDCPYIASRDGIPRASHLYDDIVPIYYTTARGGEIRIVW